MERNRNDHHDSYDAWCGTMMPRPKGWMEGKVKSPVYDAHHEACLKIEDPNKCDVTTIKGVKCTWRELWGL